MAKEKKALTAEQLYRVNKQKAKIFGLLAPITWYSLLIMTILFASLAFRNSVGNITEILNMLSKDNYTTAELQENYAALVEKWGEWELVGENSAGLVVRYVDVGNALFSGLMMTFATLTLIFLISAIILGKIVFPLLAKHYKDTNDELVDMATLKSAEQIDVISKSRKEWF